MYSPAVRLRRVNGKSFWNGGRDHEHVGTIAFKEGFQDVIFSTQSSHRSAMSVQLSFSAIRKNVSV